MKNVTALIQVRMNASAAGDSKIAHGKFTLHPGTQVPQHDGG